MNGFNEIRGHPSYKIYNMINIQNYFMKRCLEIRKLHSVFLNSDYRIF